jgi:thymidylate synthase
MHADYSGQGFDQLADVIDKLRYKREDRRIVLSAWNPADLQAMALPPCHMFAQVQIKDLAFPLQSYVLGSL